MTRERSKDLAPGTKLRSKRFGSIVVLASRKTDTRPLGPGWWLRPGEGGLSDSVIDAVDSDWEIVE